MEAEEGESLCPMAAVYRCGTRYIELALLKNHYAIRVVVPATGEWAPVLLLFIDVERNLPLIVMIESINQKEY